MPPGALPEGLELELRRELKRAGASGTLAVVIGAQEHTVVLQALANALAQSQDGKGLFVSTHHSRAWLERTLTQADYGNHPFTFLRLPENLSGFFPTLKARLSAQEGSFAVLDSASWLRLHHAPGDCLQFVHRFLETAKTNSSLAVLVLHASSPDPEFDRLAAELCDRTFHVP